MFRLPVFTPKQVDKINIGLILISLLLAYILPFELFLFSYAVLGPLHYLTEISWLHQKKYFVPVQKEKNKWIFPLITLVLTFILSLDNIALLLDLNIDLPRALKGTNIIFFLFGLAGIMVVFKKQYIRIGAVIALAFLSIMLNLEKSCISCTDQISKQPIELCKLDNPKVVSNFLQNRCADVDGDGILSPGTDFQQGLTYSRTVMFFSAYLPTLIHVYFFTMLFMLFGALKSQSKSGLISVGVLIAAGILPFVFEADFIPYAISEYARKSYDVSFLSLNQTIFDDFKLGDTDQASIYFSKPGIMIGRFIGFAYTYHYLNWFSKTSIIQWHKMPILNMSIVAVLWIASVILYAVDYKTGLSALLFLSFLHVFLEFPLNFQSVKGIFEVIWTKLKS